MSKHAHVLAILASLALATPVLAQTTGEGATEATTTGTAETPAETPADAPEAQTSPATDTAEPASPNSVATPAAPAAGLPEGQTGAAIPAQPAESAAAAQLGQTYVSETHGDWSVRCIRTESGNDPCQLYQLLQDQQDNNVAEISLFGLPPGQQAAAGATIVTPLETLLTEQLTLQVDGGEARTYPFSFCSTIGCFARVGFTSDEVDQFRRGNVATLSIVPAAAADQRVNLDVSLTGFTAGYDAVNAANADN